MTLVSVPSLAVVTTNVADGGGSISGVSGCEWQEQGALSTWHGYGAQVRNYLCDVKALKFQGCYHCIILPVLTNIPPFPGTDRIQVMSFRKRYKDEAYDVAQQNLFVFMIYT